ncbi:PREDICTED: F-box only protein 17-like [Gekko japonicus]|uniref:F-box only protein 17-like n=1 Tax=Gekko japonicus TaxID=146911 RepID=A0ABM1L3W6_GEKJA|nr:PREDICTED: F-box only protein 17-like [Gekko japonicus]
MGQARSRKRAGTTPLSGQGVGSGLDLTLLPQELLVLILSWVPGRALVTRGRLVCRQWRDLIDGPTLWKLQGERDPSGREALKAALEAARHCPRMEWARVGVLQPFGRNLVRNPRGEEQFQHWQVGHGDGVCLGDNTCWISQLVDLVKEGLWEDVLDTFQPDILISDWWGTHEKCGCTYNLYVLLLAADKNSVIDRFVTKVDPAEEWNVPFQQASHVFRKYGPGVRYLRFQHIGNRPGAERTEAHITNSTVLVKLSG